MEIDDMVEQLIEIKEILEKILNTLYDLEKEIRRK
jgi:hypothetical protein